MEEDGGRRGRKSSHGIFSRFLVVVVVFVAVVVVVGVVSSTVE